MHASTQQTLMGLHSIAAAGFILKRSSQTRLLAPRVSALR